MSHALQMDTEEKQHKNTLQLGKSNRAKRESSPPRTPEKSLELVPKDESKSQGNGKWKDRFFPKWKTPTAAFNGNSNSHHTSSVENAVPADVEMEENSEITTTLKLLNKPDQHMAQGVYRDDGGGPSPLILLNTVTAARNAVKDFSKDFVALLKDMPDKGESFQKRMRDELNLVAQDAPEASDSKFVAQAYIALQLFSGFENASFCISNTGEKPWEVQHTRDCFDKFQECKDKSVTVAHLLETRLNTSFLSRFCFSKFASLIPKKLEEGLFGGKCPNHSEIARHRHPNTPFYKSFLFAAVSIWLLQRLVFSFEQRVITYSPFRSDNYQRKYMEPAIPGIGDNEEEDDDDFLEVLFTVFPGFRISQSIVKSNVYVVKKSCIQPVVKGLYPQVDDSSAVPENIQESTPDSQTEGLAPSPYSTTLPTQGEYSTPTGMDARTSPLSAVQSTTPGRDDRSTTAKIQSQDTDELETSSLPSKNDLKLRGDSLPNPSIPQRETSAIINAKSFSATSSPKSSKSNKTWKILTRLLRARKSFVKSEANVPANCQTPAGGGENYNTENTPTAKPPVRDESFSSAGADAAGAPAPSVPSVGPSPPTDEVGRGRNSTLVNVD